MATCLNKLLNLHLIFVFLLPFAYSVSFQIPRFASQDDSILYQGDAKPVNGVIEFNDLSKRHRVGWATYAEYVPLWNPKTRQLSDFTTRFSFSINIRNVSAVYGHGFSFFLAPVGSLIPPNSAGSLLGLFNTTDGVSPLGQVVLVEFDTFENPWDPKGNGSHVGIDINSLTSANYTPWNASMHNGDTVDVLISYNATTKILRASWSYQNTNNSDQQEVSSLSYQIDLMKALPERVTVGFSGSIGEAIEQHILRSWEFNSTLEPAETNSNSTRRTKLLVIGILVPVVVLIAVTIIAYIVFQRIKRKTATKPDIDHIGPRRFSFAELVSVTNNFSEDRKLGEGGFGAVYRGYLLDSDSMVAVKRISKESKQGKREFETEVSTIGQLRHRNLVRLIGWCHEGSELLLIYEFMLNGSLDSHLFVKRDPLSWSVRYKISLQLAYALLYLHEECEKCVVHRDIKSSNIMLDSSFNVKLGDFGLARLMDHDLSRRTTVLAGTFGYMAPECLTGRTSKESDVYSFGVVLLEIATGTSAVDPRGRTGKGLVEWVWDLYGKQELLSALDKKLNKEVVEKEVEHLMIVGLWCVNPDSGLRPSIKQAIQVLNFEAPKPNLPTKMPVPTYLVPTLSTTSGEPSSTN